MAAGHARAGYARRGSGAPGARRVGYAYTDDGVAEPALALVHTQRSFHYLDIMRTPRATAAKMQQVLLVVVASALAVASAPRPSTLPKCDGPVQPELLFGCTQDHAMAEQICCRNRHYAEPSGYQEQSHVNLFPKLKAGLRQDISSSGGVVTFYDSVCGKPLFRAPIGRSFEQWEAESLEHGWPSFRAEEIIKENIVVDKSDGEVRSICGLHLGHNIPDRRGDRYCIDLVCIAGKSEAELQQARNSEL
eukprot:COSAG03_NODE_190_length_10901_cov_14.018330_6_plen_248_part_00